MKTNLYSVYDTAAGLYNNPVFARSDGEIMREFQNHCGNEDHPFGQHPEDYSLIRLGNFNDQNGLVINEDNECLATGLEMVAMLRNNKKYKDTFGINEAADAELLTQSPGGTA